MKNKTSLTNKIYTKSAKNASIYTIRTTKCYVKCLKTSIIYICTILKETKKYIKFLWLDGPLTFSSKRMFNDDVQLVGFKYE